MFLACYHLSDNHLFPNPEPRVWGLIVGSVCVCVFLDGLFPCDVYAAGCVPPAHVAFRSDAFMVLDGCGSGSFWHASLAWSLPQDLSDLKTKQNKTQMSPRGLFCWSSRV